MIFEFDSTTGRALWREHCCSRWEKTSVQNCNSSPPISITFDNQIGTSSIITKEIDNLTFTTNLSGTFQITCYFTGNSTNSSIRFSIPEINFNYDIVPPLRLGFGGQYSFVFQTTCDLESGTQFHIEAEFVDEKLDILLPIENFDIGGNGSFNQIQIMKI